MPDIIRATFSITTPAYLGDVDKNATEISPPSIKGALMFWWRAIQWGQIRQSRNDNDALQALHKKQGKLFGSSAETGEGQAQFLLRVKPDKNLKKGSKPNDAPKPGIQYLLGQGLYHFKQGHLRSAISSGTFTVECVIKPSPDAKAVKKQLAEALLALGTLGAIGSRARKGFGSLSIQHIDCDGFNVPNSIEELKQLIAQWKQTVQLPPFTAFSRLSRVDVSSTTGDAMSQLNQAGLEQQLYRSYGRKGEYDTFHKVSGRKAEQNFAGDHDMVQGISKGVAASAMIPKRSVFGLPHNYFFSSTKKNIEFTVKEDKRSRRASPLFIHVHQFPNGNTVLIQTLLPAVFLNDQTRLEFKVPRGKNSSLRFNQSMIDWNVIHAYLDRFDSREKVL